MSDCFPAIKELLQDQPLQGNFLPVRVNQMTLASVLKMIVFPAEILQRHLEMISELDPHEDVEHWIEAAVREGHQPGDGRDKIQCDADVALVERGDVKGYERTEEHGDVVRRPTQVKRDHDAEDEPDGFGTSVRHGFEEAAENPTVAESDGDEGQEEEDVLLVNSNEFPCEAIVIIAVISAIGRNRRFEDELRSRGAEAQEPDEHRNSDGMVRRAVPEHRQRVHHGHVAMHGHNREKQ